MEEFLRKCDCCGIEGYAIGLSHCTCGTCHFVCGGCVDALKPDWSYPSWRACPVALAVQRVVADPE